MAMIDAVRENFRVNDFYEVLRVQRGATQDEIKKAYLQRSLEWHPDKTNDPIDRETSNKKFQILIQIYQVLSDPVKRTDYDKKLGFSRVGTCEDIDSFTLYDQVRLSDCIEEDEFYCYDCRCSGQFKLDKHHVKARSVNASSYQNVFIVDCDSCSNTIKIAL